MDTPKKYEASVKLANGKTLRLVTKFGALRRLEILTGQRGGEWDMPRCLASYAFISAWIVAAGEWADLKMERPSIDDLDTLLNVEDFDHYFAAAFEAFGFKEIQEKIEARQREEAERKRKEEEAAKNGEATAHTDSESEDSASGEAGGGAATP